MGIDGIHHSELLNDGRVKLKMKNVDSVSIKDGFTFLDTGSPHHVILTTKVADINVYSEGKSVRNSPNYPQGTNVDFVERRSPDQLFVRTYERGVEDETWSCGTGVVASAIANFANGNPSTHYQIETLGGNLEVTFNHQKGTFFDVFLTGPVKFVFEGSLELN